MDSKGISMDFQGIGKILILSGAFLAFLGLLLIFCQRIPFLGKLPGDIFLHKGGFQFFFPLVTFIIISIVLTIILNLVIRLFR
ncbi:MAG: DUF2905 family protein [Dehalococcoidia bacterium]